MSQWGENERFKTQQRSQMQERRASLAAIPAQVAMLSAQFVAAGGEQIELEAAIVPVVEPV